MPQASMLPPYGREKRRVSGRGGETGEERRGGSHQERMGGVQPLLIGSWLTVLCRRGRSYMRSHGTLSFSRE